MDRIDMPWGYIEFGMNEVSIVSTVDDPPGVRLAAPMINGRGCGKVSFNRLRPDGGQVEVVLIQGKVDERPHAINGDGGELVMHIKAPFEDNDPAYKHIVSAYFDCVEFHVPVKGMVSSMPRAIALKSRANGKFVCAEDGGTQPLVANRAGAGPWETFDVVETE